MRSFQTRLSNSLIGVFLLIPLLLICLACAIPFAGLRLDEGMTQDEVRARFGEPARRARLPGAAVATMGWDESWSYRGFPAKIVLYFEGGKLTSWWRAPSSAPSLEGGTFNSMGFDDWIHHSMGHTHHHGHGC